MHLCSSLDSVVVVCLLLHWAQKGVDTAFWSCSKKYIWFESFFFVNFVDAASHTRTFFLQKYSIPQHLCKLFSIWLHFCDDESAAHFHWDIFSRLEFRTELPIDFYRSIFFHQFPFVFLCQSIAIIIIYHFQPVATCASWMANLTEFQAEISSVVNKISHFPSIRSFYLFCEWHLLVPRKFHELFSTHTRALCVSFPRFRFIWFGCELQLLSQI